MDYQKLAELLFPNLELTPEDIEKEYGIDLPDSEKENDSKEDKLPKPVLKSLIFILLSVAFWYMGYNAVTSAFGMRSGVSSLFK